MSRKVTFDELIARREQREADKLKIGMLEIPGSDTGLEARMPSQKAVLDLYGELSASNTALEALACGKHALYAVCPQLWDKKLQEELGVAEDPMRIVDELFSTAEADVLGGKALQFLGLIPDPAKKAQGPGKDEGEEAADPGAETVKN